MQTINITRDDICRAFGIPVEFFWQVEYVNRGWSSPSMRDRWGDRRELRRAVSAYNNGDAKLLKSLIRNAESNREQNQLAASW